MAEIHNLLHTYATKWLGGFKPVFPIVADNTTTQIGRLEMLEEQFYLQFGAKNYPEFMSKIRQIFLGAPNDAKALKNFTSENIRKTILNYQDPNGKRQIDTWNFSGEKVTIELHFNNAEEINKVYNQALQKLNGEKIKVQLSDHKLSFKCTFNKKNLEKIYSSVLSKQRKNSKKATAFEKYQQDFANYLMQNPTNFFNLTFGEFPNQNFTFTETIDFSKNLQSKTSNWGYTGTDIEKINSSNNDLQKGELLNSKNNIKNYIFNTLLAGASQELINAASSEWDKKMNPLWFESGAGKEMNFFAAGRKNGGVYMSKIIGALGEFQYAVFIKYISRKMKAYGVYPKIIGDLTNNMQGTLSFMSGEQGKTDVEIFSANKTRWGAQIKNWDVNSKMSILKTNIHPDQFVDLVGTNPQTGLGRVNPDDFLLFIANYFFNSDYALENAAAYQNLEAFLANEMAALMSFSAERPNLDTVTFYFIGGSYLVPASDILRAYSQRDLMPKIFGNISIDSKYEGHSESDFHARENSHDEENPPLYTKYWKRNLETETGWEPTEINNKQEEFSNVIHSISFRTYFDYKQIITEAMNIYRKG